MASAPISVEEAICRVLKHTLPGTPQKVSLSPKLIGMTLAETLHSTAPFPPFAASIMDGYAVCAPLEQGVYHIAAKIHAGDDIVSQAISLNPNQLSYITTGAPLPPGANAVVKIEDTSPGEEPNTVKIAVSTLKPGVFVREIGSDIALGEEVLSKGTVLGPAELGLLATTGYREVLIYPKPKIAIMSTGNELVDFSSDAGSSTTSTPLRMGQIRDSNRITLISSFLEEGGYSFEDGSLVDYGIIADDVTRLTQTITTACQHCDIIITSGGVSMGAADYIKKIIVELGGVIHFSKLNMKPGKPTTFATLSVPVTTYNTAASSAMASRQVLFFGLAGNPVSASVTRSLFVTPALKRFQGHSAAECLHAQTWVRLYPEQTTTTTTSQQALIVLDAERPEYHRVYITYDAETGQHIAYSTGNQRSSRLLSMKSANGLALLPQGPGVVAPGSMFAAIIVRPLDPPKVNMNISVHPLAMRLDDHSHSDLKATTTISSDSNASTIAKEKDWKKIKVGVLTISDRAAAGIYCDESGPEIIRWLLSLNNTNTATASNSEAVAVKTTHIASLEANYPLTFIITNTAIVPDNPVQIASYVTSWCDASSSSCEKVDLLITTGGTGFGERDYTPETIQPLLHREAPGIAQALLNEGCKYTPLAVLARPVAGTRHQTFIITLPGSVKAIKENLVAVKYLLPRIMELIKAPPGAIV